MPNGINYLPLFPKQKKLSLTDKDLITKFTNDFEPTADYKFASLWSYNTENDATISTLHGNLILKFRDYISNEFIYSFIGTNYVKETARVVLLNAKKENVIGELKLVPECVISAEKDWSSFLIAEDPNNHDYILSVTDLCNLPGSKFHTHKNHINKFNILYQNNEMKVLDPKDKTTIMLIEDVFYRWEKGRNKDRNDTIHELTAIRRLLHDYSSFSLLIVGLFIDGVIQGFSINDLDSEKYAQNHFAKSDPSIKQLYYKLNHLTGIELQKRGYEFLNIECDLGLDGLRFAKEQWNPVKYIKKYTIALKNSS